eukprot:136905-Prorocentrum_minimum.AAC.1
MRAAARCAPLAEARNILRTSPPCPEYSLHESAPLAEAWNIPRTTGTRTTPPASLTDVPLVAPSSQRGARGGEAPAGARWRRAAGGGPVAAGGDGLLGRKGA